MPQQTLPRLNLKWLNLASMRICPRINQLYPLYRLQEIYRLQADLTRSSQRCRTGMTDSIVFHNPLRAVSCVHKHTAGSTSSDILHNTDSGKQQRFTFGCCPIETRVLCLNIPSLCLTPSFIIRWFHHRSGDNFVWHESLDRNLICNGVWFIQQSVRPRSWIDFFPNTYTDFQFRL